MIFFQVSNKIKTILLIYLMRYLYKLFSIFLTQILIFSKNRYLGRFETAKKGRFETANFGPI